MKVYVSKQRNQGTTFEEEKVANFEYAMKMFKRKVSNSGVLQELRKREYFVKPGMKRRLKHENAIKIRNKKNKKY